MLGVVTRYTFLIRTFENLVLIVGGKDIYFSAID